MVAGNVPTHATDSASDVPPGKISDGAVESFHKCLKINYVSDVRRVLWVSSEAVLHPL
jgi:hypothetical protein